MPAYVVSHVSIVDEAAVDRYRTIAAAAIHQYGGRYLARGGLVERLEGAGPAEKQCMIVEFPDLDRARQWYESPEYREGRTLAKTVLSRQMFLVEGLEPA